MTRACVKKQKKKVGRGVQVGGDSLETEVSRVMVDRGEQEYGIFP